MESLITTLTKGKSFLKDYWEYTIVMMFNFSLGGIAGVRDAWISSALKSTILPTSSVLVIVMVLAMFICVATAMGASGPKKDMCEIRAIMLFSGTIVIFLPFLAGIFTGWKVVIGFG